MGETQNYPLITEESNMPGFLQGLVDRVNSTWEFLDGKKTVIGTAITLIAKGLLIFNSWHVGVQIADVNSLNEMLALGMSISTVGLLHKAVK